MGNSSSKTTARAPVVKVKTTTKTKIEKEVVIEKDGLGAADTSAFIRLKDESGEAFVKRMNSELEKIPESEHDATSAQCYKLMAECGAAIDSGNGIDKDYDQYFNLMLKACEAMKDKVLNQEQRSNGTLNAIESSPHIEEAKKKELKRKAKDLDADQDKLKTKVRRAFQDLAQSATVKKQAFSLLLDAYDAYEEEDEDDLNNICKQIRLEALTEPFGLMKNRFDDLQVEWNEHTIKFDKLSEEIKEAADVLDCENAKEERKKRGWQKVKKVCIAGAVCLGALVAIGAIVAVCVATGGAAAAVGAAAATTAAATGTTFGTGAIVGMVAASTVAVGSAFTAGYYGTESIIETLDGEKAKRKQVEKNINETLDAMKKINESMKFLGQILSGCIQDQEDILGKANTEGQSEEEYLKSLVKMLYKRDRRMKKKRARNESDGEATSYVKIQRLKTKLKALVLLANKSSNDLLFVGSSTSI